MLKRLRSVFSWKEQSPLRRALRHVRTHQLRWLRAKAAGFKRRRSDATFVAITGSSAKSSTTAFLGHLLSGHGNVRCQVLDNTINPLIKTLDRHSPKDDFVVAELGVGAKECMRPMAEMYRPDVAIVTMIGLEHYSAFRTREAVAEEKGFMVEATRPGGLVLLNADDEFAMGMASRASARVVTFGRSAGADYRVLSTAGSIPGGLTVEIGWSGGQLVLETRFLGEHFWLSVVAAAAAALELGVPPETIRRQAATAGALPNRFELVEIVDGPAFIVDTAKAPKDTLDLAFEAIRGADAPFKRIVLGQISDYAGSSRPKYRDAYGVARASSDAVIFVGDNAHRSGASHEDRQSGRFVEIVDAKSLYEHVRSTARKDELILLKSSQNLHLERVALAWNTDVRCWVPKCGKTIGCRTCGLYAHPFERHGAIRRARRRQRLRDRLAFWKRAA